MRRSLAQNTRRVRNYFEQRGRDSDSVEVQQKEIMMDLITKNEETMKSAKQLLLGFLSMQTPGTVFNDMDVKNYADRKKATYNPTAMWAALGKLKDTGFLTVRSEKGHKHARTWKLLRTIETSPLQREVTVAPVPKTVTPRILEATTSFTPIAPPTARPGYGGMIEAYLAGLNPGDSFDNEILASNVIAAFPGTDRVAIIRNFHAVLQKKIRGVRPSFVNITAREDRSYLYTVNNKYDSPEARRPDNQEKKMPVTSSGLYNTPENVPVADHGPARAFPALPHVPNGHVEILASIRAGLDKLDEMIDSKPVGVLLADASKDQLLAELAKRLG